MKKVIFTILMLTAGTAANAVQVRLIEHNVMNALNGSVFTLITDGSHISGIAPPSTAVWDWDGTTLSSVGLYAATASISDLNFTDTIISDQVVDLLIDTSLFDPFSLTPSSSATSYSCVEGTFLSGLSRNACGNYGFGLNGSNESITVWGPGTSVTQTIGGDDVASFLGPRTIGAYDFRIMSITGDGLTPGDIITLGSSRGAQPFGSATMTFQVVPVPAAAWLFGSALGLLGWVRRNAA